ncbi:MAG: SIS domain-containing protein [Candidatus Methylacidiphilales bacterium]
MSLHLTRAKKVLDIEISALKEVRGRLDGSLDEAVELLVACTAKRRKLILTGVGKSGHVAEKIAATFTSTGAPAVFLNPLNATHGDLGLVDRGDVVVALSYSGETEELCRILSPLKSSSKAMIALTAKPRSTLGHAADVVLNIAVGREACPHNLAPTSSTTVMMAVGDALAMVLLEARGFTGNDFARFHPGGSLGRHLLMRSAEVMRPLPRMAVMKKTDTVQQALRAMSKARCGAAVVVQPTGTLAGIFTHGDFSRGYLEDLSIGKRLLGEVMTTRPVTVRETLLAAEVVRLLETHQIDDVVVVDSHRRPIGLIDVQDLARLKLL